MKVKVVDRVFNPITVEVIFETQLELDQLTDILESSDAELNSLISYTEKLNDNNNGWVDTLHDILDDL